MKRICVQILSNTEVLPKVHLLWLKAPEIAAEAVPGQFVMVACGESHDPLLRRPLSIHRLAQDGETEKPFPNLALLFAVVGRGTQWLSQRKEGDFLDLLGPLGKGFTPHPASRNLLLVAGGIGIAPLVALAEESIARGRSATLIYGAETASQIYPSHLLPPGLKLVILTADGSAGSKGLATDSLPDYLAWADQIFACGPIPMYRTMAAMSNLPSQKSFQVLLEQRLGCGLGACYGCSVETKEGLKQVCKDGPVFELGEIIWEKVPSPDGAL